MRVLFLQDFSLAGKGGGAAIIKRLLSRAADYNVETCVAYDKNSNQQTKQLFGEKSFFTLPRALRFGIGRFLGNLTIKQFDVASFFSITNLISQENPDAIHVLAHGVSFPMLIAAAKKSGKKVVVSVHDLWHWTVSGYISKEKADEIFKKSILDIDTLYVISKEMQDYLTIQIGAKNYQIIHDGVVESLNNMGKSLAMEKINLLYVGILHEMQITQLNKLIAALGADPVHSFTVGICSGSTYKPAKDVNNVTIVNYGWLQEPDVIKLTKTYHYGLLPLSFNPVDELFYKTSLMTKIPFYIGVHLPIICMGPASASAVQLIDREKTGLVLTNDAAYDFARLAKRIVSITPDEYKTLLSNLKLSAASTFNFNLISKRFFENITRDKIQLS